MAKVPQENPQQPHPEEKTSGVASRSYSAATIPAAE
jgi:hypothetical protein